MARGVSFNSSEYTSYYDPIFKDTPYWDTYRSIVEQYKDGVPQNWMRQLSGQYQSDVYNHKMAYSNALNALVEQMRTDEYNSTPEQVKREKQAGLNPDLTGLSGTGLSDSASSPNQNPMTFENPIPHMVSFISMVSSAAIGAQSMVSQKLINDGMRLQNLETSNNIALSELARLNIEPNPNEIMPAFKIGFNTGSRSLDKKLESRATSLYDTISHKIANKTNQRDLAKVRKENFDITSSAGYSDNDDFYAGLAERLADAYQKLIDMENNVQSKRLNTESSRLGFEQKMIESDSEYLDTFDPTLGAHATNEANERSLNRDKQWNEFMKIQHGLIGYIRDEAKKGNTSAIELIFRIFGEQSDINGKLHRFGSNVGFGLGYSNPFE